jgi:hypothetical protein
MHHIISESVHQIRVNQSLTKSGSTAMPKEFQMLKKPIRFRKVKSKLDI